MTSHVLDTVRLCSTSLGIFTQKRKWWSCSIWWPLTNSTCYICTFRTMKAGVWRFRRCPNWRRLVPCAVTQLTPSNCFNHLLAQALMLHRTQERAITVVKTFWNCCVMPPLVISKSFPKSKHLGTHELRWWQWKPATRKKWPKDKKKKLKNIFCTTPPTARCTARCSRGTITWWTWPCRQPIVFWKK